MFLPGNQFILLVFWFTPVLDIIVFLSIGSKVYYDVWLDSNIVADDLQVDCVWSAMQEQQDWSHCYLTVLNTL